MMATETFKSMWLETPSEDVQGLVELARLANREATHPHPLVLVEIGSWAGRTAIALADAGYDRPHVVYCVDTWKGSDLSPEDDPAGLEMTGKLAKRYGPDQVFATFCNNVGARLLHTIIPLRGESMFWAPRFSVLADLVFIDAEHSYQALANDLAGWSEILQPGGVMACHDYGVFPGVTRAIREFTSDKFQRLGRTLAWWRKS